MSNLNYSKNPLRLCIHSLMVAGVLLQPMSALAEESVCYAVADNDRYSDLDVLVKMHKDGATIQMGSDTIKNVSTGATTTMIEAVAFDLAGDKLYTVDGGLFGTLNLESAEFTPIGDGIGSGTCNADGDGDKSIDFNDIDGLTFDFAAEGIVYATLRREHNKENRQQLDLLIRINPATGKLVPGWFDGKDCVPVKLFMNGTFAGEYHDVDDLASDPQTGVLYAVLNTGDGVKGELAKLEVNNGIPTGNAIWIGSNEVDDIESLTFDRAQNEDGSFTLYGTTGDGGADKQLDPLAKHRLYAIDKSSGKASMVGRLIPPVGDPQRDFESVSCHKVDDDSGTCLMYAIHDEGQVDSQLIEIDPFAGSGIGAIRPLGPLYKTLDLEALAIHPVTGKLYATSGSDQQKGVPDGALYEVNRDNGLVKLIGLTGYSEVSALGVRLEGNVFWGWARGGDEKKKTQAGPITINLSTGKGELVKEFGFKDPEIKAIAWSPDSKKLYAPAVDYKNPVYDNKGRAYYSTDLFVYDPETKELSVKCDRVIRAEIEAMEMQPDGLLLMASHNRADIGIIAFDPEACQVVATRTFKNATAYYDIESIEWPEVECDYRSWLYPTSGDAEIELVEYPIVPENVKDAVCQALNCEDNDNISVETDADVIKVYSGDMTFVVRPAIYNTRRGARDGKVTEVAEAQLIPQADSPCLQLNFGDDQGNQESWQLCPVPVDEQALLKSLNTVGENAKVSEEGIVSVTIGGTEFTGELDIVQIPASHEAGKPIEPIAESATAELVPVGDKPQMGESADGVVDIKIDYPNDSEQILFLK